MNLQGPEGKRNGLAAMMGVDFPVVHADLQFEGQAFKDVAVRYKGNSTFRDSRDTLKRSLKVDLNKFVRGQRFAGVTKLNLQNNVRDASWMNEVLSHRLFCAAGVPAPRTAYARVYVTVPGKYDHEYLGLYSIVENVDNAWARERHGTKKGAIFKPVTRQLFLDLGNDWAAYRQTYDPKTPLSAEETQRVIAFSKLASHASDTEFAARLESFLDLDQFARFMAVTTWLSTLDSILVPGHNFYVYLHPKTHQFQFIPWDLDHSFGRFPLVGSQEQRENLSIHKPWLGEIVLLDRVFKVEQFKRLYLARMKEFSETIFNPDRIHRQVDEIAAAIRSAVQDESAEKLARFDKEVAGEAIGPEGFGGFGGDFPGPPPGGAGGGGPRFGPPGRFGQPGKPIKGFVIARAKSVNDQLAGRVEGAIMGGFGFGGPGGPGGPGGQPGPGGPGGPGGFGPGMFLGPIFVSALDADKDGEVTEVEFTDGFRQWFESWDTDQDGVLTDDQLRAGIDKDLSPFRGRPPMGFGPPPGF
jgi:spore coat protein CotH